MRIGLFTEVYFPYVSGVVTSVDSLKRGLEKKGHEVFIITTSTDDIRYKIEDDGHLIRIPAIKIGIKGVRIATPIHKKTLKYLKNCNLDIIHTQTEFGVGTFGKIIAKKLRIPHVHTFHSLYERSNNINYITHGLFPNLSLKFLQKYMNNFFNKDIRKIIVPSSKTEESLRNFYKVKNEIIVIPNGIELNNFYKENYLESDINNLKKKYKIANKDFVILYVGRLGIEKNIEFLIKNHLEIIKKNKNIKLLLVGGGDYIKNLTKVIDEYGLNDYIIATGGIPHNDIGIYYQLGDVFATASTFETQGLTNVEALASSIPVVCINDKSFTEVVIDNYNGLIFNNDKEYIEKILAIAKDRKKLKMMKLNARMSISKFSVDKFSEDVISCYLKVIEEIKNGK